MGKGLMLCITEVSAKQSSHKEPMPGLGDLKEVKEGEQWD